MSEEMIHVSELDPNQTIFIELDDGTLKETTVQEMLDEEERDDEIARAIAHGEDVPEDL